MYQEEYLDEMLHLTADIAEELLAVKDTGNNMSNDTAEKIARLAELAVGIRLSTCDDHRGDDDTVSCVPATMAGNVYSGSTYDEVVDDANDVSVDDKESEIKDNIDLSENLEDAICVEGTLTSQDENIESLESFSSANMDKASEEVANDREIADAAISEEEADANIPVAHISSPTPIFTARELRNAFTLNDVFLFQRTLFHGSSIEFKDALEEITSFTNVSELEDYLQTTHGIDVKSPEAEEFIAIVSNFFHV